jgi:hypothetical protein
MPGVSDQIRFRGGQSVPGGPALQGWGFGAQPVSAEPRAPREKARESDLRFSAPQSIFVGDMYTPSSQYAPAMEPEVIQEPMRLGMFQGSFTFLAARVDPNGSSRAREAIVRGGINGENAVRGIFGFRSVQ